MQAGICLPHYGRAMEPAGMRRFAETAESLGFDSLWVTDHLIIPQERDMLYKEHMLEPLATLAFLAGVTSNIRIGTSVIVLPYRHPVLVAKAIATADLLSNGRVIFGAGVGGLEGEFKALNANFTERGAVADEALWAMKRLWTKPSDDLDGRSVSVKGMFFSPQPAQRPHPPIWIGGSTKRSGRRAVDYGDAWHATNVTAEQYKTIADYMSGLSARRGRARPPALSVRMPVYFDGQPPAGRMGWGGSDDAIVEQVQAFLRVGVEHVVFGLPDMAFEDAMGQLHRLAEAVVPKLR